MRTLTKVGIAAIFLMCALTACHAQVVQTVVSGTITDPNGVPYAGGTIDATLVPTGTTPTVAGIGNIPGYVNQVPISQTGTFTLPLYCNASGGGCTPISPSGTQWLFTVRNPGAPPPVGFGGVSFTVTLTITGATQSISSQLQAAAPQLVVFANAANGCVASGATGDAQFKSSTGGCTNAAGQNSGAVLSVDTSANFTMTSLTGLIVIAAGPDGENDLGLGSSSVTLGASEPGSVLRLFADQSITLDAGTGVKLGDSTALEGAGTLDALGLFVNGKPVVNLAGVNSTTVTITGPGTGSQNLQAAAAFVAGAQNAVGKTFAFHTGGTVSLGAAGEFTLTFGIGTGTGSVIIGGFTPGATATTYRWSVDGTCTTTTAGASGSMQCVGHTGFGGSSTSATNMISPFDFTISAANLTNALTFQMAGAFTVANSSNAATEDVLTTQLWN
jgi:hypothetical protein